MRFFHILCRVVRDKVTINKTIGILSTSRNVSHLRTESILTKHFAKTNAFKRQLVSVDNDDNEIEVEILDDISTLGAEPFEAVESGRNIIFKDSNDLIVNELNKCVSVEEVLNLFKKYENQYEDQHITQTIFVLRELQKMYNHYNSLSSINSKEFVKSLHNNQEFSNLLMTIKGKLNSFKPEYLSYVLLYLNKLGISVEDDLMQAISLKVRDHLIADFSLDRCSRFLKVIFTENSVRPYYMSLEIIPKVNSHIETCDSVTDLENLTICLNKLHTIVTNELLLSYKDKVEYLLKSNKLKGSDYQIILKIILFLNYPEWRNSNVLLTSDCILLMKNYINLLNITELLTLYEIFFKNQEPGEILNSIQRCSAKYLQQLEETDSPEMEVKLKLFSSLIYFSSPTHRIQFRRDVEKFSTACSDYSTLVVLRKIYSFIKISDKKLCTNYWNQALRLLHKEETFSNIVKLCQNYMNFNTDIDNYRHYNFERKMLGLIESTFKEEPILFLPLLPIALSFVMIYGKNETLLELLLRKAEENITQLKASDCYKISRAFKLLSEVKDNCISKSQIKQVQKLMNECSERLIETDSCKFTQNNVLLKAAILRNDFDNGMTEHLLTKFKEMENMSSKMMENICYIFLSTDSLIPEVVNKCTEYVIHHRNNILGFNAEKILYLCYYMAYYPINADEFFEAVTDIIISDRERLSGLGFLQSALSLSFFNKLPSSFIKQIFNVEFMEKLDVELANCYSKDKYPQRVRNSLMQLNRTVCMEYPEYNVPWFHKKYLDETQKKIARDCDNHFQNSVKEYLTEILGKSEFISENVMAPYGYHIDFVVSLNKREEAVSADSPVVNRRVALLLTRQHAFTRFYTHLKGKYQLKKRHLEMFGYTVSIISFNEWINLLYSGERLEYLSNLIWAENDGKNVG